MYSPILYLAYTINWPYLYIIYNSITCKKLLVLILKLHEQFEYQMVRNRCV